MLQVSSPVALFFRNAAPERVSGFRAAGAPASFIHHRLLLLAAVISLGAAFAAAPVHGAYHPSVVATVFVEGFDSDGASQTGVFGKDARESLLDELAEILEYPTGLDDPAAPNQIAMARYYGDVPPPYYTQQDIDELNQVTATWGGGIPRYALIMAKFTKHVLERSGARQVNLAGASFGGLITRWMVEKDVEGLVSSGKIARWITIEGVVAGNWAATAGANLGILDRYGVNTADVQQMHYNWIRDNLHNDRRDANNPLLANIRIHHWRSTDDDMNDRALSLATYKPNDGVQLVEDMALRNLSPASRHLGLMPMISSVHATHQSVKQHTGIRAGLIAQMLGRRRVTVKLDRARVLNAPEPARLGDYEIVFGCKVRSPLAKSFYDFDDPVNEQIRQSRVPPLFEMKQGQWKTTNMTLFDDMVLPGETELILGFEPYEIDIDAFYGVFELSAQADQALASASIRVSTENAGSYFIATPDWEGEISVSYFDYPPYLKPASAVHWADYP